MSPALARFLTSLHSSQWKSRYGAEFEALLTDIPATTATICDVTRSVFVSQRRLICAGLLILAIIALPFHETKSNARPMRVAARSIVAGAVRCGPYTSVLRRVHGRCVLG